MKAIVVGASLLVSLVAFAGDDLGACGDKSLSAGGIRMQRALAARYPASILAYAPPASRLSAATRELNLSDKLREVGHKYREVTTLAELQASAASGQYNIVLADLADVAELQSRFESSPASVVVVPVAYNLTKAEISDASKTCRFMIKAPGRAAQYLVTIAQAVRSRGAVSRKS